MKFDELLEDPMTVHEALLPWLDRVVGRPKVAGDWGRWMHAGWIHVQAGLPSFLSADECPRYEVGIETARGILQSDVVGEVVADGIVEGSPRLKWLCGRMDGIHLDHAVFAVFNRTMKSPWEYRECSHEWGPVSPAKACGVADLDPIIDERAGSLHPVRGVASEPGDVIFFHPRLWYRFTEPTPDSVLVVYYEKGKSGDGT